MTSTLVVLVLARYGSLDSIVDSPRWMKGQFCVEPESFAQIRKELPEFPSDWKFSGTKEKDERRGKINDLIHLVHANYKKRPNLDDLYRIVYLGEQVVGAFDVVANYNSPKVYDEILKYDVLPSDFVKRLFFCSFRQRSNQFGDEFAEMMLSKFGYDDKIRAAYLGNSRFSKNMTLQKFNKCLGLGIKLARTYRGSDYLLQVTEEMVLYAIASKHLDLHMLDEIEKSFSGLEALRVELFGKLKPGTVYMKLHKDFAKRKRAWLEKGGG